MGSTTFGNVTPAIMTGPAMPRNIKIIATAVAA
jgi:hypothetical protein